MSIKCIVPPNFLQTICAPASHPSVVLLVEKCLHVRCISLSAKSCQTTQCYSFERMYCHADFLPVLQNLVDSLAQRFQEPIPLEHHAGLKTFVVFNKRRRVTSSAKRKRVPDSTVISQTPDGSFLDLMQNSREVLQRCGFTTPEVAIPTYMTLYILESHLKYFTVKLSKSS